MASRDRMHRAALPAAPATHRQPRSTSRKAR
jgi:hypothetical protein